MICFDCKIGKDTKEAKKNALNMYKKLKNYQDKYKEKIELDIEFVMLKCKGRNPLICSSYVDKKVPFYVYPLEDLQFGE